ncbi:unnamed protein product [Candida verbasci]|uniref:tRNA-splicing endonuclease subunit Sen2 n=1 Tax=Candida verbasci TaxID=1227364 RepID=A0A9W4U009_9ASCO|nr:unnamed protein product [Candida verbasci]
MAKKNNKNLNKIYKYPLPLIISSNSNGLNLNLNLNLPNLFPHNPISWIWYSIKLLYYNLRYDVPSNDDINVVYKDGIFKIENESSMRKIWRMGFFGKGVLSRSEPTWKERTLIRLNLIKTDKCKLTMEDITRQRRAERTDFKKKRQKLQDLELKKRKDEITDEELKEMDELDKILVEMRKASQVGSIGSGGSFDIEKDEEEDEEVEEVIREEDSKLIDSNGRLIQIEYVQLQFVETFFLKFALNTIKISNFANLTELFKVCCNHYSESNSINPDNKFILEYLVYHYYRSMGWCVRSGIKFGTDYLLYKRGPPFMHAEFCLLIMDLNSNNLDWFQVFTKARVVGSVKKTLVLVYVETPTIEEFNQVFYDNNEVDDEGLKFLKLFKLYKISEVIYKRWNPSRTRD